MSKKHNQSGSPADGRATEPLQPADNPAPEAAPTTAGTHPAGVSEASLTPVQVEELKARAAKADEHWDRLLRTLADLENLKKRAARERQDAVKFANESLLTRLIPTLDHFDMARAAADSTDDAAVDSLKTGIALVHNQLKAALAEAGLEEIDAANQPFDPNLHEAVSQEESAEVPEGHVVKQLRKGYKLRERLLRPASVIVARKPAS
ncbi:MAG TPA: nucleotide exchange factor GrpE [Verrucomicrobiae bacterium]|nr:nucleotide exchange factor GrpE [Verrucomicrobiae bacterium]